MRHRFRFTFAALAVLGLCASPRAAPAQTVTLNDPWQRSASSPNEALPGFIPQGQALISIPGLTAPYAPPADSPSPFQNVPRMGFPFYTYTLVLPLTPLQRQRLAAAIKIGMSRAQVDGRLQPDGGLTSSSLGRYSVGEGTLVDVPSDDHGGPFSPQNRVCGPLRFYRGSFHTD